MMQEPVKYEVSAFFLVNDIEHKVLRHIFRLSPVGSIGIHFEDVGVSVHLEDEQFGATGHSSGSLQKETFQILKKVQASTSLMDTNSAQPKMYETVNYGDANLSIGARFCPNQCVLPPDSFERP